MKSRYLIAVLFAPLASAAHAEVYKLGPLVIGQPWTRVTPKNAPVAGGYLKITNNGASADRFVGAKSDASDHVEIHEMSMTDGVMKMRPLPNGLEIKPGETVELKSGGYRLYSRKVDPKSGKRKNLGTFETREAAQKHERAIQYFKRKG